MPKASASLLFPLTFPGAALTASELIEQASLDASPCSLISWGLEDGLPSSVPEYPGDVGIAMGCEDGSIFLFHYAPVMDVPKKPRAENLTEITASLSKSGITKIPLLAANRPTSPTSPNGNGPRPRASSSESARTTQSNGYHSHLPSITSRTQAAALVSTAQVEAPKNYVDFDNEPDKLKDMLRSKGVVKDRGFLDALRPDPDNKVDLDKRPSIEVRRPTIQLPSTLPTSRPMSPEPSSPISIATKAPTSDDSVKRSWKLRAHIIPPLTGVGHAVRSLAVVEASRAILSLQESGTLSVISVQDGRAMSSLHLPNTPHLTVPSLPPSQTPNSFLKAIPSQASWSWRGLQVSAAEAPLILVCASDETRSGSRAREVLLLMKSASQFGYQDPDLLTKVGEWVVDSPAKHGGMIKGTDGNTQIFHLTQSGNIRLLTIQVLPAAAVDLKIPIPVKPFQFNVSSAASTRPSTPHNLPLNLPSLPNLPNPFKGLNSRTGTSTPTDAAPAGVPGRVEILDVSTLGAVGTDDVLELNVHVFDQTFVALVRTEEALKVFKHEADRWTTELSLDAEDIISSKLFAESHLAIIYTDRIEIHDTTKPALQNGNSTATHMLPLNVPSLLLSSPLECFQALHWVSPPGFLLTRLSSKSKRKLELYPLPTLTSDKKPNMEQRLRPKVLWASSSRISSLDSPEARITASLPLELNLIILGYSDGTVERSSLPDLLSPLRGIKSPPHRSPKKLNGAVVSLSRCRNSRTNQVLLVGGGDDGSIGIWDFLTLELCGRWVAFTTPLMQVISLEEESVGRLRGCLLCVSEDGTVAAVSPDGFELLYLIPGSAASLKKICLGQDNLILIYNNGRARLWDVKTLEFWRSMENSKAEELVAQGGWVEAVIDETFAGRPQGALLSRGKACASSTILVEFDHVRDWLRARDLERVPRDGKGRAIARTELLRLLLDPLLPSKLNDDIDDVSEALLGGRSGTCFIGLSSFQGRYLSSLNCDPKEWWQLSPVATSSRLLVLLMTLRLTLGYNEMEQNANQLITFFTGALREAVGTSYQSPLLSHLTEFWYHSSLETRQSARSLFDAAVASLPDSEVVDLVEQWQHSLPCLQPDAHKADAQAAIALLVTGHVASERYPLLSASTLTDIAKSITLYFHDDASPHRVLAIDLCASGFQIWQHYVDAMEILRSLFALATGDAASSPQARAAVLQIASSNTPLFITTLALDIAHPQSVDQRKSIMPLVAFLIRKKPLVLYPNLPKLVEAVVKSLDPNSATGREAVLDAATEILAQVVKTFPTVDFHAPSQRLAVGTSEGAVIMYDLNSATRLYVLEGHRKRIVACSFSPDGRRLVTVSLEESVVLVWKVGSSLISFFTPGAPPRQGHGNSDPFKTLAFNVGDEAYMTTAATLEWHADVQHMS
ncbi:WD40 repeat-like protein [Sistotremastrum suecicum HHB10207 ss-3]|uniref:WD40 repeat-like protein n=1 Tax=Sistotremastrum suecicum HHB10207 ss-3 TaxID=1314776 RepID=A0A166ESY6_9AGAM|nr:WD40 repeat-like protein [Sistotremastrum suecicum HHB10207 ss-3]